MVGILGQFGTAILIVPGGYVSGTFLSDSATYSGTTLVSLGVTPGTYVWTWGTGANQNFTLQIPVPPPPPVTGPAALLLSPHFNGDLFNAGPRLGSEDGFRIRLRLGILTTMWISEQLGTDLPAG